MTNKRILIGEVSGCFGVKGWLKIFSYAQPRENIANYKNWYVDGILYKSVQAKKNSKLIVAKIDGVEDKESAQAFIGKTIEVDKADLKALSANEYYWHDLVGLTVVNQDELVFGRIKSLLETGAHDVIIVAPLDKQGRERLIPYLYGQTVVKVDLENKIMQVNWHEDD